jgi:hypothetical protein
MIRIRHILVMTAFALGLTAATVAAPQSVPIKGEFTTTFVLSFPTLTIASEGNASHLGLTTAYSSHTLDLLGNQTGPTVFTAANGDQLFATAVGTASPPDVNGIITLSGTLTFTGGTGNFSGATGTSQLQGTANIFASTGQYTFTGTISY